MSFLISFGICSTEKLSKYNILLPFTYKAKFLLIHTHHDLLHMPPALF